MDWVDNISTKNFFDQFILDQKALICLRSRDQNSVNIFNLLLSQHTAKPSVDFCGRTPRAFAWNHHLKKAKSSNLQV